MKDFEQLGFDISAQHGVCSVNEHSESHYNLQKIGVKLGRYPYC